MIKIELRTYTTINTDTEEYRKEANLNDYNNKSD
mgnify:CR=1 FL=1